MTQPKHQDRDSIPVVTWIVLGGQGKPPTWAELEQRALGRKQVRLDQEAAKASRREEKKMEAESIREKKKANKAEIKRLGKEFKEKYPGPVARVASCLFAGSKTYDPPETTRNDWATSIATATDDPPLVKTKDGDGRGDGLEDGQEESRPS